MTKTTATLNRVTSQRDLWQPDDTEVRIMKQYRAMRDKYGKHGHSFTIVLRIDGAHVEVYGGVPAGRVTERP